MVAHFTTFNGLTCSETRILNALGFGFDNWNSNEAAYVAQKDEIVIAAQMMDQCDPALNSQPGGVALPPWWLILYDSPAAPTPPGNGGATTLVQEQIRACVPAGRAWAWDVSYGGIAGTRPLNVGNQLNHGFSVRTRLWALATIMPPAWANVKLAVPDWNGPYSVVTVTVATSSGPG